MVWVDHRGVSILTPGYNGPVRNGLDETKLRAFIQEVGNRAQGPGRVYLVGGATALLLGIREQTVDVDIKLDPEPKAIFEGIAAIKTRLAINVELASPDLFLPPLPGWQDRSEFIVRSGPVDFYHYDFYAQTLAKLLRGYRQDRDDALAFVARGKVDPVRLWTLFEAIREGLIRYPAIDPMAFQERVRDFVQGAEGA